MMGRPVGTAILATILFGAACVPAPKEYSPEPAGTPPDSTEDPKQPDHQDMPMGPSDGPPVDNPDSGTMMMPPPEMNPPPVDPNAVQFARDVLPVLEAHCTECHHAGRPLDFTNLPADMTARGMFADAIIAAASSTMPPAPRDHLTAEQIALLQMWKSQGLNP